MRGFGLYSDSDGTACPGRQWASCYCVRKGLIRKAHLAHNLKKWSAKHPGGKLAAAVPETLVMEVDDVEYIDEALADVYEVSGPDCMVGLGDVQDLRSVQVSSLTILP